MDADALALDAAAHPFDVLKITPSHLGSLLAGDRGAEILPRRWLVVGGEALPWELADRVQALNSEIRVLNHYGPTETTVGCCVYEVPRSRTQIAAATVPIGAPLPGARTHVVDDSLNPLPAGVPGELCIGGAGVAAGYIARPEETAARFVADPFATEPHARLYRSGDRARRLQDGTLEYLGRLDDQVKVRGHRVEPGEIEAVLTRHPAVRQAVVAARDDDHGNRRLVAYVVGSPSPAPADLEALLTASLPEYMVPSAFVELEALPLSPSGKVDRRALPEPAGARRQTDYVAPRDPLEEEIAAVWADLLDADRIGVNDDFFALGGHSLLATQAIMRIRRRYGDIPLRALLDAPTVAGLAEGIRGRKAPMDAASSGGNGFAGPSGMS
jgi:acyl-coenzyme A synthetase/AMP-(fatty) acid ligase